MTAPLGAGWDRDRCNEWFRYHSEISYALTMQRTALESALIPVTAYIVVACVECYRRYPAMVQQIADARAARGARRARVTSWRHRSTPCDCGRFRTSRCSAAR